MQRNQGIEVRGDVWMEKCVVYILFMFMKKHRPHEMSVMCSRIKRTKNHDLSIVDRYGPAGGVKKLSPTCVPLRHI